MWELQAGLKGLGQEEHAGSGGETQRWGKEMEKKEREMTLRGSQGQEDGRAGACSSPPISLGDLG